MASHNILALNKKGFTLIEVLVVIGILGIILALALVTSLGSFKRNTFQTEQSILVSVLEKARNKSMNNMFELSHGVCYISPNYVIFRDSPSTRCIAEVTTNEIIPADGNIANLSNFSASLSPTNSVIFSQLTGKTASTTIFMTDGIKSTYITINNEGTINW